MWLFGTGRRAAQKEEPRRRENCDGAPRSMSPSPKKAPFPNITSPGQMNDYVVSGSNKKRASAAPCLRRHPVVLCYSAKNCARVFSAR
jgi:hypothetical protein